MSALSKSRQVWAPVLVIALCWVASGLVMSQDKPASQPASQPATTPVATAPTTPPAASQPVNNSTAPTTRPPTSDQASRPASQEFSKFQELQEQNRKLQATQPNANSSAPTSDATTKATSRPRPWEQRRNEAATQSQPNLEEIKRRAQESAARKDGQTPTQPATGETQPPSQFAPGATRPVQVNPPPSPGPATSTVIPPVQKNPTVITAPGQDGPGTLPTAEGQPPTGDNLQPGPNGPPPGRTSGGRRNRTPNNGAPQAQPQTPATENTTAPAGDEQTATAPVPADGRDNWFSYSGRSWEDVVRDFARRLGKPLMGEVSAPIGELTYVSPRRFTKQEALDELNFLLVQQGFFLAETTDYVYSVPISELPRLIPPERVYDSIEKFNAANLRDMEFNTTLIRIPDYPAEKVRDMFLPSMPDTAIPTIVADTNSIKITGLAKDVRRFMSLYEKIKLTKFDPAETKIFKIKSDCQVVAQHISNLLNVGQATQRFNPQNRTMETVPPSSKLKVVPDPRTNTIVARGTPDELREVKDIIDQFDILPDIGKFETHIVPVVNGNAVDIANILNNIFTQEQGQSVQNRFRQPPRPLQPGQPGQPGQPQPIQNVQGSPTPQDIIIEDMATRASKTVRLVADDRTNSLIVYANQEGFARVQELLKTIDQPVPSNYRAFKLENAEADAMAGMLDQLTRQQAQAGPQSAGGRRNSSFVPDPAGNILHVVASREDMGRIEDLIKQLDVPTAKEERHIVQLVNIKPSTVASLVESLLSITGAQKPGTQANRGNRPSGPGMVATQRTIALDQSNLLLVFCTTDEWKKVEATIKQADDQALSDVPALRFFPVTKGNPDAIAATLQNLYRTYRHPTLGQTPVTIDVNNDQIIVQAIKPALDEIERLVKQFDVETTNSPLTIIKLESADANQLAQIIQQKWQGGTRNPRGAAANKSITADAANNLLLVQADRASIEEVRSIVRDYEKQIVDAKPVRRFMTPKNTPADRMAQTLEALFSRAGTTNGTRGRGPSAAGGSAVKAVASGNQVIIDAAAELWPEIEEVFGQIDDLKGAEIVIVNHKMAGADVTSIAQKVNDALALKVKNSPNMIVRLAPDPTSESILITATKDAMPEIDKLLAEYEEFYKGTPMAVEFRQLQNATANDAATWLQPQLVAMVQKQFGSSTANQVKVSADPRTNRVIISAPQVAVTIGKQLLDQYDVPQPEITSQRDLTVTDTRRMNGHDVANLSNLLTQAFGKLPPRPDKLTASFGYDLLTSNIIFTVPKDWVPKVDELLGKFATEGADLIAMTQFIEVKNADAAYVADQITRVIIPKVRGSRGPDVASRINMSVDTRLNRIIMFAPKFVVDQTQEFVNAIDVAQTINPNQITTITLKNADANTAVTVLNSAFAEELKTMRTMKITVDPVNNSVIISGAGKEKTDTMSQWLTEYDNLSLANKPESKIYVLQNASSQELSNVLNTKYGQRRPGGPPSLYTFAPINNTSLSASAPPDKVAEIDEFVKKYDEGAAETDIVTKTINLQYSDPSDVMNMINQVFGKQRQNATGQKAQSVQATVTNSTLIVKAPTKVMPEIQKLIDAVDSENPNELSVKVFDLKVMNAGEIGDKINLLLAGMNLGGAKKGGLKPMAYGEKTTNKLVVIAPKEKLPMIQALITEFESTPLPTSDPKFYALINTKAEQLSANIETLLKAKVAEREGVKKDTVQVKVMPEPGSNRLIVFAPKDYQALADQLIKTLDERVDTGEIVHIIPIDRGDANAVAQTVNNYISKKTKGATSVSVIPDVASNSVILSGLPRDVADIEKMVKDLDASGSAVPELQIFKLKMAGASDIEDTLKAMVAGGGKGGDVSITSDEYGNRLIVATSKRKMRQIEGYIQLLDREPDPNEPDNTKELHIVDVVRGDPWTIAFDVGDMFPPPSKGGPTIDADLFNPTIKVICRPTEFPKIERMIHEFDRSAKIINKTIIMRPKGDLAKLMPLVQAQFKDVNVTSGIPAGPNAQTLVEYLTPENEDNGGPKREPTSRPRRSGSRSGERIDVLPYMINPDSHWLTLDDLLRADPAANAEAPAASDQPVTPVIPSKSAGPAQPKAGADAPKAQEAPRKSGVPAVATNSSSTSDIEPNKVQIVAMPDGRLSITGPKAQVEEIQDAIDLLQEDTKVGEVIRIFAFRHGDVNAAARILELMFNDSQRQGVGGLGQLQQLQQMQMMQMQQQMQQAAQRNQRGAEDEKGGSGKGRGGAGGSPRGAQQGQPGAQPGQGAQRIRIAVDSGNNYLIIKCDESDLPDIRQLLKELDIKPGNVEVRVFQLKNLAAEETANNIKTVLGIDRARGAQQGGARNQRGAMPGAMGFPGAFGGMGGNAQMLEIFQQQLMSLAGSEEGAAKIESVEIVPNSITNSVLVSAPSAVMKIVEDVIEEMEGLEGRGVITIKHHKLDQARAEDVLPLLQEIFTNVSGGGARGGGAPGGARAATSPAEMGPVTISADPRSNEIIYTAQTKDVPAVEAQITMLDFAGDLISTEAYTCKYADAANIAATVSQLFVTSGAGAAPGRRGQSATLASEIKITAEPFTNTILVNGSIEQREKALKEIEELDQRSKRDIRQIEVRNADPEKLATRLNEIFGGQTAGAASAGSGRRGGSSAVEQTIGRLVIKGDKASGKLLVRAPDVLFDQILETVKVLDQPSQQLQIKRFQLNYAKADAVVDSVKSAMVEYLTVLKQTQGNNADVNFDPFVPIADPRTNSVIVVGSQQTFSFVDMVIHSVDMETNEEDRKAFRIFGLTEANAQVVADAINQYSSGTQSSGGGNAPGGQRRTGAPSLPGMSGTKLPSGYVVDVQAVPELDTNSVMVFGKRDDIDLIEKAVIEPLEGAGQKSISVVKLENAQPSDILATLSSVFQNNGQSMGGPNITPNDDNKTLIVFGTKAQQRKVSQYAKELDTSGIVPQQIKTITVPLGQDAAALATTVDRLINGREQQLAQAQRRAPRLVSIGADPYSNKIIVYSSDPSSYGMIEALVKDLGMGGGTYVTRVIELRNLSADDAQKAIDDMQRNRGGSRTRSGGGGFTPAGGNSFTPGMNQGNFNTPRPQQPAGGNNFQNPQNRPAGGQANPGGGNPRGGQPGGGQQSGGQQGGQRGGQRPPANPGGGGAFLTPTWQSSLEPATGSPAVFQPLIATFIIAPEFATALELIDDRQGDNDAAQDAQPAPRPARPAASAPRRQPANAQSQEVPSNQPTPADNPENAPGIVDITSQAATQPLRGISGSLRGEVVAAPIDSRRIIITGDSKDVDFIEQMLALMESSAPSPEVRVFPLKNTIASAIQQPVERTVQALIQGRTGRTPDRSELVSILAEGRSNSLIVAASPKNMDLIAEIIDRIDEGTLPTGTEIQSIDLFHIRAAEAADILKPIIDQFHKIRQIPAESQAQVTPIDRSNQLMVVGTQNEIDEIRHIVENIDVDLNEEGPKAKDWNRADVMVINMKNAVAEDVAKVLTDMISERAGAGGATGGTGSTASKTPQIRRLKLTTDDGRELPPLDLDRPIRILSEKGTNSLVVFSSPHNNEALREIAGIFDTLPKGEDVDVKAITVQHGKAKAIADMLTKLFEDAKKSLARPAEGGTAAAKGQMPPLPSNPAGMGLPYHVTISSDDRSNSVVVIGRKDGVLLAAAMVSQLDKSSLELSAKPHVLQLKNVPASVMQTNIQKMLDERAKGQGGTDNSARDSAVVQSDDRTNSLVVLSTDEIFGMVSDLVTKLDGNPAYRFVETRQRKLEHGDPAKFAALLNDIFDKKSKAGGTTGGGGAAGSSAAQKDSLTVTADARTNQLIMTGSRDYLAEAEELINKLDQQYDPTVQFRIHAVKFASAPTIASLINDMVTKTKTAAGATGGASGTTSGSNTNLSGTPMTISSDAYSNTLLLGAAREDMDMIERWIEMLDKPAEPGRVTRILPLRRGKADDWAKQLQTIFPSNKGGTTGGTTPGSAGNAASSAGGADVTIIADTPTNSIIAVGPPSIVNDIESLVKNLTDVDSPYGQVVRIFKLTQADAGVAGSMLRSILSGQGGTIGANGQRSGGGTTGGTTGGTGTTGSTTTGSNQPWLINGDTPDGKVLKGLRNEVTVIDDARTNSLVVTAPPETMQLVESLVSRLDVPPTTANIRIFPLRNSDATAMVTMLQKLFPNSGTSGTSTTGGGTTGGANQAQRILSLGEGEGSTGIEQLMFTSDTRTNSVIAAGTPGYLKTVEEMILQLDSKPIQERKTIVYAPRNNTSDSMLASIKSFSDGETQRLDAQKDDISQAQKSQRQILAVSNKDANRLVLSYDPRYESTVLDLVRDLDQPPAQVMIQVLIIEVELDNALDLGIEFAMQDLQFARAGANDTTTFDYVGGTDLGAATASLGGFSFTITGRDFDFLFRALQTEGSLNVLSRPQIVAQDNQDAKIEITNQIPIVNGTSTSVAGQITSSVAQQDAGIKLDVTPQINPDGFVRLKINQEVSDVTSSTVQVAPGINAPIIFKRTATTTVTVKDNETIVLGGLITSRDETNETKVPFFGDIPILGAAFRHTQHNTKRNELLIVMTPRVIRTIEDFRDISTKLRDQSGLLPDAALQSPLMEGLQVKPEDLIPLKSDSSVGPFPPDNDGKSPKRGADSYGPDRPSPQSKPARDDGFDIPVTRAGNATASVGGGKQ